MNVFCADFLLLHFGFIFFCWKAIGKESAHKMLLKLTTLANFPNIYDWLLNSLHKKLQSQTVSTEKLC